MVDYFAPVLAKVKDKYPDFDRERLNSAYKFAAAAHDGQKRCSGEDYITHPVAVMDILLNFSPDEDMLVACLLHDVSEDTVKSLSDIETEFGEPVANLVRGLEKLSKVRSRIDQPEVENLRKMFVYMAADLRIIIIKLCDRLHNMRTLEYMRLDKQRRIAAETLHIYAPIAARLGIYEVKSELEDLCFMYLEPDRYHELRQEMDTYIKQMGVTINEIKRSLQQYLASAGYRDFSVEGRIKNLYSVHKKMLKKGRTSLDEIYDVFAMRVIVPDQVRDGKEYIGDLYAILGALHSHWRPLPHRFKDYIALPKPNGYRSLHTTLIGLGPTKRNQPTEIQIRTKQMHEQSLHGIAAHWLYDQSSGKSTRLTSAGIQEDERLKRQLEWVTTLSSLQEEIVNNNELIATLQSDIFSDRIFVLTPAGDVKDLPVGATAVDFAFAVHTELGLHCAMARVNGRAVSLEKPLDNGDVIEIVSRPNANPSQYWLSFVKTNLAKSKIRNWLKQNQDPAKSLREGREILNSNLEELGQIPLDAEFSLLKNYQNRRLTLREREDVVRDVGRGLLMPTTVIKRVFSERDIFVHRQELRRKRSRMPKRELGSSKKHKIIVDGHNDLPLKFATCCKPAYPNRIIGYVNSSQELSIHTQDCQVLPTLLTNRFVAVHWEGQPVQESYRVTLELVMEDRVGLLRDISQVVSDMGVNITGLSLRSSNELNIFREFEVLIDTFDKLVELIRRLKEIPNVRSVRKVN